MSGLGRWLRFVEGSDHFRESGLCGCCSEGTDAHHGRDDCGGFAGCERDARQVGSMIDPITASSAAANHQWNTGLDEIGSVSFDRALADAESSR